MVAVGKNGFYGPFQLDRLLRVVADTDCQSKLKSRRVEAGFPSVLHARMFTILMLPLLAQSYMGASAFQTVAGEMSLVAGM